MALYVIDIETDGLHSTLIHVMSIGYLSKKGKWKVRSTKDTDEMIEILSDENNTVVGHFFKQFDVVELERVLNFKVKAEIFDTLVLAWYIYPKRTTGTFGLGDFGKDFGIEKPPITDWENLSYEEYEFRCESDVKINIPLWLDIKEKLIELYGTWELALRFIRYMMFKTDCLVHQQLTQCRINMEKVSDNIDYLTPMLKEKEEILIEVMPPGKVDKTKPKVMHKTITKKMPKVMTKANGDYSVNGQKWMDLLAEKKLPEDTEEIVTKVLSAHGQAWMDLLKEKGLPKKTKEIRDLPNPNSNAQLKEWLFSFDWKPELFTKGANGPVPQLRNDDKELCDSVLLLAEKEPAIHALEGLTVLNHRIACLKAFADTADYKGYVTAAASGFTNTLRLRHKKPIVNLPGVTSSKNIPIEERDIRDGRTVRECIVAIDGHVLCGSDISGLEEMTKLHYMKNYDPDYVAEVLEEGYDAHLSLAVKAGALTEKQSEEHKLYSRSKGKKGVDHGRVRHVYKTANYSCIYGVGISGLARATGLTQRESRILRDDYWGVNWSIDDLCKDIITKVVDNQMWLINPVNQYWYSVRNDKDIFSTLNQGTGAFIFDLWIRYMNESDLYPFIQYHDEVLLNVEPNREKEITKILDKCMKKVNKILKLNVEIKVDVQFGKTYADVH